MEEWKDIAGYEGYYQVSNLGRVRSLDRTVKKWDGEKVAKGIILKQSKNLRGYLFVELFRNGIGRINTIHRLVAGAFIKNPNNLSQINHKDEDKTNNKMENLEWCDSLYNARFGTRTLRASMKISKKVLVLTECGEEYGRYDSVSLAAKSLGKCKASICNYLKKGISPDGLIFKYQ